MANIKSAKKRILVTERNRKRNLVYKNKLKRLMKEAKKALKDGKADVKEIVSLAIQAIDKAVKKNVIKQNNGSRKKSHLMKALAKKA